MNDHQPNYINIARAYIANSMENGFARMFAYDWLDRYVKNQMPRKELVRLLAQAKVSHLKICSILAELDQEKENELE